MNFKKLEKKDIHIFKEYIKKTKTFHSPYSLSDIFLWDECLYNILWTEYKNFLIISENPVNNEKKRILLPLPYKNITPNELKEIMNLAGYKQIWYVEEDYIIKYMDNISKIFNIIPNNPYSDYIYLSTDLYELKGSRYSPKRNLINQFEKNYLSVSKVLKLDINSLSDILLLMKDITNHTDKNQLDMLDCEKKAIYKIKELSVEIEFFGICVYLNQEIKGFAIGSELNDEMCICNFEKADKKIKGLYQFVDREFSRMASSKYKFINKESDLGKDSLRKAKESYHPIKKIESFILEIK